MSTASALSRLYNNPLFHKLRSATNFMFRKHLLLTNLSISTTLSATGDILQQHYEVQKSNGERPYNSRRTFNMWCTGGPVGFVCHHWYNLLDKYMPGRTLSIVCKKVVVDQLFCSPVVISTFFVTLAIMEQRSIKEFFKELKSKSWRLYLAEWIIWPPAQLFNFYILPTRYRVLYDNTISLGYDVYTSYVVHEIDADDDDVEETNDSPGKQDSSSLVTEPTDRTSTLATSTPKSIL